MRRDGVVREDGAIREDGAVREDGTVRYVDLPCTSGNAEDLKQAVSENKII